MAAGDGDGVDRRKGRHRQVAHRPSEEERQRILLTSNEPECAALAPGLILPVLADRGPYNSDEDTRGYGSERSPCGVLYAHGQAHRCGRARAPQESRPVPRLRAAGQNQMCSMHITDLPTTVRGVWLHLSLVIDVWSRKGVAWAIAEREDPANPADLVGRACLRERISKGRKQPLALHADNGKAIKAATWESRLKELGVLQSCSRPCISNDNHPPNRCSARHRRHTAERSTPA